MNPEPTSPSNIFLIGYRCTGKSSVGKRLAARLNRPFVDTDDMLVADVGLSIKDIVAQHGWDIFRSMERAIVKRACKTNRHVVATGGGVVLDSENVDRMKGSGRLIWLQATLETIKARMEQDSGTDAFRPALTSTDRDSEIEESLMERDPLYRHAADHFIETDDHEIEDICDTIINILIESQG